MIASRPAHRLSLHLAPDAAALAPMRAALRRWLGGRVSGADSADLELVATELCANALEAGSGKEEVVVEAELAADVVCLGVTASGPAPRWPVRRSTAPLRPRGRGLDIVEALVDRLALRADGERTTVSIERRVEGPGLRPGRSRPSDGRPGR